MRSSNEIRQQEFRLATMETLLRLHAAGAHATDADEPGELARLLDAVEAFEKAVQRCGGDLMVDEPNHGRVLRPDHPRFVIPSRTDDEGIDAYRVRIIAAADRLNAESPDGPRHPGNAELTDADGIEDEDDAGGDSR